MAYFNSNKYKISPYLKLDYFNNNRNKSGKYVFNSLAGRLTCLSKQELDILYLFSNPSTINGVLNKLRPLISKEKLKTVNYLILNKFLVPLCKDKISLLSDYKKMLLKNYGTPNIQTIYFFATDKCNLNCKYCYIPHHMRDEGGMSMNRKTANIILKEIFSNITKKKQKHIDIRFLGGEPLLNYKLLKYIMEKVKKTKVSFSYVINTNLTKINNEILDWMRKNKRNVYNVVSLDGSAPYHDMARIDKSEKGTFNTVVRGIKMLQKNKIPFSINCVVSNKNMKHIPSFLKYLKSIDINHACISFIDLRNKIKTEEIRELTEAEKNKLIIILEDLSSSIGFEITGHWRMAVVRASTGFPFTCTAGTKALVFTASGNIYPCSRFIGINQFVLGRAKNKYLSTINKNNPEYFKWINKSNLFLYKKCINCSRLGICMADCNYSNYKVNDNCNNNAFVEDLLKYYLKNNEKRLLTTQLDKKIYGVFPK